MQYRRQKIRKEDYRGLKLKEEVYLKLKHAKDKNNWNLEPPNNLRFQ